MESDRILTVNDGIHYVIGFRLLQKMDLVEQNSQSFNSTLYEYRKAVYLQAHSNQNTNYNLST